MNVTLVSVETKATRFNIVRSLTLFTFGYPNLMLSLLQYISFCFNINIATFVGTVFAYVVLRTFTYTSPSRPSLRLAGVLFSCKIRISKNFDLVCSFYFFKQMNFN